MTIELVLATTNSHKIREFKAMLKGTHFDIRTLLDFPHYVQPSETENTFEGNARLKAEHAAKALNRWVLADDSGLVVPALDGAPGVYSARYAGDNATDHDNRKKLLHLMQHLQEEDRHAYYECCLVLASPSGVKKCASAVCEGTLLAGEKGGGGFGYDPLFLKDGYGKTFAELDESIKNRVSHRRKAYDKLIPTLESIFAEAQDRP